MAAEKRKHEMVKITAKAIATGFYRGSRVYAGQVFDIMVPLEDGQPRCAKWFEIFKDEPKAKAKAKVVEPSTVVIDSKRAPVAENDPRHDEDAADLV